MKLSEYYSTNKNLSGIYLRGSLSAYAVSNFDNDMLNGIKVNCVVENDQYPIDKEWYSNIDSVLDWEVISEEEFMQYLNDACDDYINMI